MFLLILPIALGALALGAARITNVTTTRGSPLRCAVGDPVGVRVRRDRLRPQQHRRRRVGRKPARGWVPLGVGAVALAVFVLRQLRLQRRDDALLDLRTFTSRTFTFSIAMLAISMLVLFGVIILLPIYMQNVLGLDVLHDRHAAVAGRPHHGAARPDRRPDLRPHRPDGAADHRFGRRQRRALVHDAVHAVHARLVGARCAHQPEPRPCAALHAAVHRGSWVAEARSCTRTAARSSARCNSSPEPPGPPCSSP